MDIPRAVHRHLYPYLLVLFPIMVHIVGIILQDCVFGGLIYFISPIFPNWDLLNKIGTDFISPCHIQHLLGLRLATQTTRLDYLN